MAPGVVFFSAVRCQSRRLPNAGVSPLTTYHACKARNSHTFGPLSEQGCNTSVARGAAGEHVVNQNHRPAFHAGHTRWPDRNCAYKGLLAFAAVQPAKAWSAA